MYGQGNISYNDAVAAAGGGGAGTVTGASNGLTDILNLVQLGQAVGAVGDPAALLSDREIPMAGFRIHFKAGGVDFNNPISPMITGRFNMQTPYLERFFTSSGSNVMPWERLLDANPNGGPPDDNIYIQGWNIDARYSNTQPSWTSRMEYRYTGSYYEYHDPQWASGDASRVYRLQSFTMQDSGIDAAHDQALIFFKATGFEIRPIVNDQPVWSVSNGIGTSADQTKMELQNRGSTAAYTSILDPATTNTFTEALQGAWLAGSPVWNFQGAFNWTFIAQNGGIMTIQPNVALTQLVNGQKTWQIEGPQVNLASSSSGHTSQLTWLGAGAGVQGYIFCEDNFGQMQIFARSGWHMFLYSGGGLALHLDTNQTAHFGSTIDTADPGAGVGAWLLGTVQAAAVALDAAHYVQVKINGVLVKLAIVV